MRPTPTGLALVMILTGAIACGGPRKPEFRAIEDVRLRGARLDGRLTLTADAVFFNPNPVGFEVTAMDLEVFVDGRAVGTFEQRVAATMRAASKTRIPLEIEIPLRQVLDNAGGLMEGLLSRRTVRLRLEGWIGVRAVGVELRVPFEHESDQEIGR